MAQLTNLMEEVHASSIEQLLKQLFPPQTVSQLSSKYHGLHEALFLSTPEELATLDSIGEQSIRKILAFRELSYRIDAERSAQIKSFNQPKDVYNYLYDMRNLQQEQFRVVLLNTKNRIIGQQMISQGTINASIVSPREVFHVATKHLAANIIIVHNHPSGDYKPSKEDMLITKALVFAGKLLEIPVVDHVIISHEGYFSFLENGVLATS